MQAFDKKIPLRSPENVMFVRTLSCLVCGTRPVDVDHIVTRGARGGDDLSNLQPLCREHHTERHSMGIKSFVDKYKLPIVWENGQPKRIC